MQASPIDQIDTEKKLWRSSDKPPPVLRFRPYNPEANSATPDDDDFHDEVADNDPAVPLASRLLFVHQEQWQKDLLAMYGDVCLLDATHRCTKYDIPLFFLVVATNVGYTVVAEFCTQSERAEDIAEALGLLKDYNPLWKPSHFMTDYSEAELLAIEQIFPNVRSYLCDFHREQAWLRWCKDKKHGLEDDTAAILLDHLRKLAYAPTCREGNEAFDKYYREAEAKLQQLPLWQQNRNVRGWFTAKWLSCPEDRPVCGHRKIVVPLLISSSHWVLAVLDVPNQLLNYYDSFGSNPIDCPEFCLLSVFRLPFRFFHDGFLECSTKNAPC